MGLMMVVVESRCLASYIQGNCTTDKCEGRMVDVLTNRKLIRVA